MTTVQLSSRKIVTIVDQIGAIQAQIDALKEQQDVLKAEIAENGTGNYRGTNFTLVFSQCERKSTSWAKVAAEIQPPAEIVAKYTSASLVNTFKITALVN
jgi:FtsZ-binding cell division protein ZapB